MRLIWKVLRPAGAALVVLLAGSCGFNNSIVSLDYRPDLSHRQPGPRLVGAGRFADFRRQGDYNLGTVRSPIGTPMESLTTRVPVENIVRNGFGRALAVRGMLAPLNSAQYLITGEILDLRAGQYVHPTATARLRVNLVHAEDGRIVFTRIFDGYLEGETYIPGSGSPVPGLTELVSRVLQNVIDQAVDSRGLRGGLKREPTAQYSE